VAAADVAAGMDLWKTLPESGTKTRCRTRRIFRYQLGRGQHRELCAHRSGTGDEAGHSLPGECRHTVLLRLATAHPPAAPLHGEASHRRPHLAGKVPLTVTRGDLSGDLEHRRVSYGLLPGGGHDHDSSELQRGRELLVLLQRSAQVHLHPDQRPASTHPGLEGLSGPGEGDRSHGEWQLGAPPPEVPS